MYTTTISSQGQITLPKSLRTALDISQGDLVTLDYNEPQKTITISRTESFEESAKRISSYIKPGTPPLRDVRKFIENSNWGQQ